MDLNHINLPAFVVADLYHSSLIESGETQANLEQKKFLLKKNLRLVMRKL
jgi:hypothetical protein